MKIISGESEVWWIALADELRAERGTNAREMIARVGSHFQFLSVPTQIPTEGGLVFERGSLGEIVVGRLTIFPDGLNILVPSTTDDAERVLQSAIELFFSLGVRRPITPPLHYPISRIIADFDNSIDALVRLSSIYESIGKKSAFPGQPQLLNLSVNVDPSLLPKRLGAINPTLFRIERRSDIEYSRNRYFSYSHMTTENHIAILHELDQAARLG